MDNFEIQGYISISCSGSNYRYDIEKLPNAELKFCKCCKYIGENNETRFYFPSHDLDLEDDIQSVFWFKLHRKIKKYPKQKNFRGLIIDDGMITFDSLSETIKTLNVKKMQKLVSLDSAEKILSKYISDIKTIVPGLFECKYYLCKKKDRPNILDNDYDSIDF